MNKELEKDFNLGGKIETALNGQYSLSVKAVLKEAGEKTVKHFVSFTPAILGLLILQVGIFFLAIKLQLGDPSVVLDLFKEGANNTENIVQAIMVANFSYEVITAPIFAGVCLLAMSHSAGIQTRPQQITKGLQFTIPVILATLMGLVLQTVGGMILPFVSAYLSMAFTHSTLLICDKKVSPMYSLLLSLRAINKKIFVITGIYAVVLVMFIAAAIFYGIGLIFVLPFFFHVKAILYREMFGIRLRIVVSDKDGDQDDQQQPPSRIFNA